MTLQEFVDACPANRCPVALVATRDDPGGHEAILGDDSYPTPLNLTLGDHNGRIDAAGIWHWDGVSRTPLWKGSPITRIDAWRDTVEKAAELLER